jgi:hypothetical protein
MDARPSSAGLDLYWIPLSTGDPLPIFRWKGRFYDAVETGALVTVDPVGHRVTVLPISMDGA